MRSFLFWFAVVGWVIVAVQNLGTAKKIYDFARGFFPGAPQPPLSLK